MQMFLSVSGHSSELSRANHSSRSTVSQLKCVSNTTSSWFENHQPKKTKISTDIYAPFIPNSNQMASKLTVTTSFPRVFFNSCNFQGNVQAFRLTGLLQQFNSAFAVSFHSTRSDARVRFDTGVIFLDQSQFLATHSNQWNCFILNRS